MVKLLTKRDIEHHIRHYPSKPVYLHHENESNSPVNGRVFSARIKKGITEVRITECWVRMLDGWYVVEHV